MSTVAEVRLWGSRIGAVLLEEASEVAVFEYDPEFARSGIQVSPLTMPLSAALHAFPGLNPATFHGLPGLLSDSLPDRYGHALIDAWLSAQGRAPESFDAVERLCYVGQRGMGALEFAPVAGPELSHAQDLHLELLVELASDVLARREELVASLARGERQDAMHEILSVGTSAGGARAKAVIAWNPRTDAVRSGQVAAGEGFEHWLLKFDGVEANRDKDRLADPRGYGAIEFAYSRMVRDCGIAMTECRLLEEGGRRHFMTKRSTATGAVTSCTCSRSAASPISTSTRRVPTPTSRRSSPSGSWTYPRGHESRCSAEWSSTSWPGIRTITSRTSRS